MSGRRRADRLLVARGLFDSRAKAQAAIEAGLVRANGVPVRKAAEEIPDDARIEAQPAHPYVSRGALKLVAALDHFGVDPRGGVCLDVGASTGGFSVVRHTRGAARVHAVDVGHGQLHPSLQDHPRLTAMEGTDIRTLTAGQFDPAPDLVTIDVSFISLKLVLPAVSTLARTPAFLVTLIKPQFEAGRAHVKKGVVRDEAIHRTVCDDIVAATTSLGWQVHEVIPSPIAGGDGNCEFLLGAERR
jgi:23S rRNA (cytidine1920-2'-O)/16S rRNA (cytidine1409-2'-O)-methyltransferase